MRKVKTIYNKKDYEGRENKRKKGNAGKVNKKRDKMRSEAVERKEVKIYEKRIWKENHRTVKRGSEV